MTRFPLAEKFKSPQGEGLFTGQQMAFLRTLGCSVGKGICTACDTEFDKMNETLGGGLFATAELLAWAEPCKHVCLTGGEPFDRDLRELLFAFRQQGVLCHVETSGTKRPEWLHAGRSRQQGQHLLAHGDGAGLHEWRELPLWITVSPKPGFLPEMVEHVADEIKWVVGGLGDGPGWPGLDDALRWADAGKLVFVQPRNGVLLVDRKALDEALRVVDKYPQLRLSCQLHKFLEKR